MNKKNEKPPMVERKADLDVNGDKINQAMARQREKEKKLFPLRVSFNTVIYVPKEKCNHGYAEKYKRRMLNESK